MRYYCLPIRKYVSFFVCKSKVLLVRHSTGEVLCCITMPFYSRNNYWFINNKDYPWLYSWLIEKEIAEPTSRKVIRDGFSYYEFKFKKGF